MKLHSPAFEKSLKLAVKKTIAASPALKQEYRRVKNPRQFSLAWLGRMLCPVVVAWLVAGIQRHTGHTVTALAAAELYLLAVFGFRVLALGATEPPAFIILPVTDEQGCHWRLQKFVKGSVFLLLDLIIILGALAAANDFPLWKWCLVIALAAVAWANMLALAVFAALRLPRAIFAILSPLLYLLGLGLFFGRSLFGPIVLHLLDQCALEMNVLLPISWPIATFTLLAGGQQWWLLLLWLPVLFILTNLRRLIYEFQSAISYREPLMARASDLMPAGTEPRPHPHHRAGPTEIEEIICNGSFLEPSSYPLKQFPEQQLWRWLTPRQKALAQLVHPRGMAIAATWKKIYFLLIVMALVVTLLGSTGPALQFSLLGLCGFITVCLILATLVNHGQAFAQMRNGGAMVPLHASYGLGFRELNLFFLKHSAVQLPFLAGACMLVGALAAWYIKWPFAFTIILSLKLTCLLFAGRFIPSILAFSACSNDTSRFTFGALLLIVTMAGMIAIFIALAFASLLVRNPVNGLLLLSSAFLIVWLSVWVYSLFYRFGRFDLIKLPDK